MILQKVSLSFVFASALLGWMVVPVLAQTIITTPPAAELPTAPSTLGTAPSNFDHLPPGEFLDEVVVTATRRPTRIRDTTVNTYIVTKQDMRALGAIDLREALQLVPGFSR